MTPFEPEERRIVLEERRLEEELARKDREINLREKEYQLQREQFDTTTRNSWRQVYSPLGVAILAGLLGLAGTFVTGRQNLSLQREKQRSENELQANKQRAEEILERQKQQSTLLLKLAEQSDDKQRARNLLFFAQGGFLTFSKPYQSYLRQTAGLETDQQVPPPSFGALVSVPPGVNEGLEAASAATMTELLGAPCAATTDCSEVTNANLRKLIVTENVGSIHFRGLRPAVMVVKRVLQLVQQRDPTLFAQIKSQGMLCCRTSRGTNRLSLHSWGTAIDLSVGDAIAPPGRSTAQYGVTLIAPLFKAEKFVWGVGEGPGDSSIHFAASEQLVREWHAAGLI